MLCSLLVSCLLSRDIYIGTLGSEWRQKNDVTLNIRFIKNTLKNVSNFSIMLLLWITRVDVYHVLMVADETIRFTLRQ